MREHLQDFFFEPPRRHAPAVSSMKPPANTASRRNRNRSSSVSSPWPPLHRRLQVLWWGIAVRPPEETFRKIPPACPRSARSRAPSSLPPPTLWQAVCRRADSTPAHTATAFRSVTREVRPNRPCSLHDRRAASYCRADPRQLVDGAGIGQGERRNGEERLARHPERPRLVARIRRSGQARSTVPRELSAGLH